MTGFDVRQKRGFCGGWRNFDMSQKTWAEKTYRGTTEATSEAALIQQLREQELFLVESKNLTKVKGYKKLKAKQLAAFCRELSTLLASGVSLVRAMDILVDQEGLDPKEKEIYKDVLLDLRKGVPLFRDDGVQTMLPGSDDRNAPVREREAENLDQVTDRLAVQYEKTI